MSDPKIPTPEELQKKLAEFMKSNFGSQVHLTSFIQPEPAEPEAAEAPPERVNPFEFKLLPRDIKAHLDRFVIKQDEAKKVLSVAVCDHYNAVRYFAEAEDAAAKSTEYAKQNVILIGPTGVGKTYLIKHIADLVGVPFVKADATKFSETGYVGGDVEDLVRDLVHKAGGDVGMAQYGIIYIDEIDKIASSTGGHGRDVSGRGVQTTLLKLMEETDVPLRNPMDVQSQIQAALDFQKGSKPRRETINTRHILFIVSGAFEKLRPLIERRVRSSQIGFSSGGSGPAIPDSELFQLASTRDYIDFGLEPEFIGRLPVRVLCEELDAGDLFDIMNRSQGSIIRQYERAFGAFGIGVFFEEEALRIIAERASREKTGARGLLTVCEKILREYKYALPGAGVTHFSVNKTLIDHPAETLKALLDMGNEQKVKAMGDIAREFVRRFAEKNGGRIELTEGAVARLVGRAEKEGIPMRDLCMRLFKEYEFGLKLIRKNDEAPILITEEAVEDLDKFLSEWLVRSYRGT